MTMMLISIKYRNEIVICNQKYVKYNRNTSVSAPKSPIAYDKRTSRVQNAALDFQTDFQYSETL
jgi:hypothetical protein